MQARVEASLGMSRELKFLVGFFYFSGWQTLYEKLQANTALQLKVLVGLDVGADIGGLVERARGVWGESENDRRERFIESLCNGLNHKSLDGREVYEQWHLFANMLREERLIIKKTRDPNHAKLYLFRWNEDKQKEHNKKGNLITGSSNLTRAGLQQQNEFNVEISDYGFSEAEAYFDALWKHAVLITEDESTQREILNVLENKSQFSEVTPFEAYALVLKKYVEMMDKHRVKAGPATLEAMLQDAGFHVYEYQLDAVRQALSTIKIHGGVIVADVVGLGKSVIASLVAKQLRKRGLVVCPPGLIGDKNQGTGWHEYIQKFELHDWDVESIGKIEELVANKSLANSYEMIIVDEAHRFRNEDTSRYEALHTLCRNKQVLLLTATPFNNSASDIYSLLKLFMVSSRSSITTDDNLNKTFDAFTRSIDNLSYILKHHNSTSADTQKQVGARYRKEFDEEVTLEEAEKKFRRVVRKVRSVIAPVVIRRNRLDLQQDVRYRKNLPELSKVSDPEPQYYKLTEAQFRFYDEVIDTYFGPNGQFTGAIYRPFSYKSPQDEEDNEGEQRTRQGQSNLFDFLRRLLVKRFESSFGAFSQSVDNFLHTHNKALEVIQKTGKYVLARRIIDIIYEGAEAQEEEDANQQLAHQLEQLVQETKHNKRGDVELYELKDMPRREDFVRDIEKDKALLERVKQKIEELDLVENDPKRAGILDEIQSVLSAEEDPRRKIVLFTEYADTVAHLKDYLHERLSKRTLACNSSVSKGFLQKLKQNFDAKSEEQKDDYDVLITTDMLSEGVNLNRAGLVINYDIPWNPTRVIQRIGRINRISKKVFDTLRIYNFFPTEKGAEVTKMKEIASHKMLLIHEALGEDVKVFEATEKPSSSRLFAKLQAHPNEIEQEQIHINTEIRNRYYVIKDRYPEMIKRISELPHRVKTAKEWPKESHLVVVREKGTVLFPMCYSYPSDGGKEMLWEELLERTECAEDTKRLPLSEDFWKVYEHMELPQRSSNQKKAGSKGLREAAKDSLKYLLRKLKRDGHSSHGFTKTLFDDLSKHHTLPISLVRKLVISTSKEEAQVLQNIEGMKDILGEDYLDIALSRVKKMENEVVIAIENQNHPKTAA